MPYDALGHPHPTQSEYLEQLGLSPETVERLGSDEPLAGFESTFPIVIPFPEKQADWLGSDGANGVNISLRGDSEMAHGKARGYPRETKRTQPFRSQLEVRLAKAQGYREGRTNPSRTNRVSRLAIEQILSKD